MGPGEGSGLHVDQGREPAAEPLNRRERNKVRTRRAIEAAAMGLFDEQGYDRTTLEQIASRADVSLRTFFRYYRAKEEVLISHRMQVTAIFEDLIAARPVDEPPLRSVRIAYDSMSATVPAELGTEHLRYLAIVRGASSLGGARTAVVERWEDAVAAGLRRRGEAPPGSLDPELAGSLVGAVLRWAGQRWWFDPQLDLHATVQQGLRTLGDPTPA